MINAKQTMLYFVVTLASLSNSVNSVYTHALSITHKVRTLKFSDFRHPYPYAFLNKGMTSQNNRITFLP